MDKDDLILSILTDLKNEVKELNIRCHKLYDRTSAHDVELANKVNRDPEFNDLKYKVERIYVRTITYGALVGGGIAAAIEIGFKVYSIINGG